MPPYYALMLGGKIVALQVVAVVDANLFTPGGPFAVEPSLITVIHDQAEKYCWLNDFALKVIRNQNVELTSINHGSVWGKLNTKFPADFFAFQVQYDKFSENKNPQEAVRQYIIDTIFDNIDMNPSDTIDNS